MKMYCEACGKELVEKREFVKYSRMTGKELFYRILECSGVGDATLSRHSKLYWGAWASGWGAWASGMYLFDESMRGHSPLLYEEEIDDLRKKEAGL